MEQSRRTAVEDHIFSLHALAGDVATTIGQQVDVWIDAFKKQEAAREAIKNAARTLDLLVNEIRGEQEILRDADKALPPNQRLSCLTAGSAAERDRQFEVWLNKFLTLEPQSQYTRAYKEVKRIEIELMAAKVAAEIADRKIAALRTVADLHAARLLTLSKML